MRHILCLMQPVRSATATYIYVCITFEGAFLHRKNESNQRRGNEAPRGRQERRQKASRGERKAGSTGGPYRQCGEGREKAKGRGVERERRRSWYGGEGTAV
mmetsp:Transcript_9377/g.20094  ORF Transcript_9377/g.20094 Transcript_9377/m.20094 type:complete len:101 (+) Transcript_9377:1076-1378(+)